MDWLEYVGLRQVLNENKKLVKNYHLANGVIDPRDYIPGEGGVTNDLIDNIVESTGNPFSLKFFPIIRTMFLTMVDRNLK